MLGKPDELRGDEYRIKPSPERDVWQSRVLDGSQPLAIRVSGPCILAGLLCDPGVGNFTVIAYDAFDVGSVSADNQRVALRANTTFDGYVNCPIEFKTGLVIVRSSLLAVTTVIFG